MNTEPAIQISYLRVLDERTPTLSGSSDLRYAVLANTERTQVFLTILSNSGGGNFNKEIVAFVDIENVLADLPTDSFFGSNALRGAITGRSSNNAGFFCAALVHAGLLAPAAGVKHKLVKAGDWPAWQAGMLARDGDAYIFQPAMKGAIQASVTVPSQPPAKAKAVKKDRRGGNGAAPTTNTPPGIKGDIATDVTKEMGDADHP